MVASDGMSGCVKLRCLGLVKEGENTEFNKGVCTYFKITLVRYYCFGR